MGQPQFHVLPQDLSRLPGLSTFNRVEFENNTTIVRINCYHPTIGAIGDPTLSLTIKHVRSSEDIFRTLRSAINLMSVDTLVVIRVDANITATWGHVLEPNSALRTLRLVELGEASIKGVFYALSRTEWMSLRLQTDEPRCKALREVEIVHATLTDPQVREAIEEGCMARKDMGLGLERLDLLEVDGAVELWARNLQLESGIQVMVNDSD